VLQHLGLAEALRSMNERVFDQMLLGETESSGRAKQIAASIRQCRYGIGVGRLPRRATRKARAVESAAEGWSG